MRTRADNNLSVIWSLIVRIALIVALAYLVYRVRSILITIIISAMLAYVLLPAVDFLCRKRIPKISRRGQRLLMTVVVFIAFIAVVSLSVHLMFKPIQDEARRFKESSSGYTDRINLYYDRAKAWYVENIPPDWQEFIGKPESSDVRKDIARFVQGVFQKTLGWLKNIVEIILIPVLAFYFVLDSRSLKREFVGMLPPWRVREALKILREVSGILQSYVVGQIILCLIAGLLTGIVLNALNMPYVLVLAVFAGITRAIPVIGPVVSGIPICILGALQSTALGIYLLIFVVIMHFAESKFIMPILIGERMKLHPAVILIVLLIGAEFFGVLGMFLAAPVAAIVRELLSFYIVTPRRRRLLAAAQGAQNVPSDLIGTESL